MKQCSSVGSTELEAMHLLRGTLMPVARATTPTKNKDFNAPGCSPRLARSECCASTFCAKHTVNWSSKQGLHVAGGAVVVVAHPSELLNECSKT